MLMKKIQFSLGTVAVLYRKFFVVIFMGWTLISILGNDFSVLRLKLITRYPSLKFVVIYPTIAVFFGYSFATGEVLYCPACLFFLVLYPLYPSSV
jgi:hypothetical protein